MKKILSIDGGGIRGVIPAIILAEIEKQTGKSISSSFDLIAGTSTGGILGLALCKPNSENYPEYSAEKLTELYEKRGSEIFSRSFWKGVSSVGGLNDEKYSHEPLEKILKEYFGDRLLKNALTKVLISSYDIENRTPFFFKSWRDTTNKVSMRSIARATSAAPTYFEPFQLRVEDTLRTLVDGGVYVNNPAMSAYAEARKIFPDETDFMLVSLGTGELTRPIHYEESKDWGLIGWALPVMSIVFDGVSDAVDYQLNLVLEKNFHRLQTKLDIASDDMDNTSKANIEALKTEARKIISYQKKKINHICELISQVG